MRYELNRPADLFSDASTCNTYMRRIKWWPDGNPTCPNCGSGNVGEISTRAKFQCRACRKQTSYKSGTIFEDSPLGLDKWFVAVWSVANCNISSHELARVLGVTQKTAWFMICRIRAAIQAGGLDKPKNPGGWKAFDSLARGVVSVPKRKVEAQIAANKVNSASRKRPTRSK